MELRHLRYFVAVAAHGNFNRAAASLHLTQPALSRQVKDLEEELGVMLLNRGKNAVTMTESGIAFFEEAREVLARAEQAVQRVRGEGKSEILRVGYAPSMTVGIIPGALEKFQAQRPRVRLELTDLSSREMNQYALEGRLDLVITMDVAAEEVSSFQWTELRRLPLVLVVSRRHPLSRSKEIKPSQIINLPLVGFARGNFPDYIPKVRALFKPLGITPHFVDLVNDGVTTLLASLEAKHAAAVLVSGIEGMIPRSLVARPFTSELGEASVKLGVSAAHPNPQAELFARLLREEAERVKSARKK
jgi:LysR family hca operon transcriptional activator